MSRSADIRRHVERGTGYAFREPRLLMTALTHVSSIKANDRETVSYQRLEFLGDRVLGLIVSDLLYKLYPQADEGELSKRLADLVRKESCAAIGEEIGLTDLIQIGPGGNGGRLRASVLGDVCEALIGAIYLDGGLPAAHDMVARLWGARLKKPFSALRDPKTVLQEWALGRGMPVPVYREVARTGPDHKPEFCIAVSLPGLEAAQGRGASKQAAEKAAASSMLVREGVIEDDASSDNAALNVPTREDS
jgi:ribonuclease-3